MADSNIGSLPQAENLDDDSLLVAEQQGQAVKVTGAQFKEFGRQAVIGQVQGYVDQAEAAANRAADAVSAVTDMAVEAHSSETPTVTKTIKNGKVNLAFGLPRGEQGVLGPEGKPGPGEPRVEERTAAALEAQVLMMTPAEMSESGHASAGTVGDSLAYFRIRRNYKRGLWSAALVNAAMAAGQINQLEAEDILNDA